MSKENDESFCRLYKFNRHSLQKNQNYCAFSKLNKLKMQEQLILNHRVLISVLSEFVNVGDNLIHWKAYLNTLKKRYCEIKNLYEDIRCNISTEEKLQSSDIEDIRKDVLNLEQAILSYKNHLQTELTLLQDTQAKLYNKVYNEDNDHLSLQGAKKFKIKSYNYIVPSPVKTMINTPCKNEEVQRHQDFLRKHGPCGGWNKAYHDIFLKTYQKCNDDHKYSIVNELVQKLPGLTLDDIIKHIDWYNTYQTLKYNQQQALNKWRESKDILKLQYRTNNEENTKAKPTKRSPVYKKIEDKKRKGKCNETEVYENWDKKSIKIQFKNETVIVDYTEEINVIDEQNEQSNGTCSKSNKTMYMQSTEQWINRCNNYPERRNVNVYSSLNNMSKLMIPKWRRDLHV